MKIFPMLFFIYLGELTVFTQGDIKSIAGLCRLSIDMHTSLSNKNI